MPSEETALRPPARSTVEALWPDLEPALTRAAAALAGRGEGRPVLLGIDGRSGSGKTDLAAGVVEAVTRSGLRCAVVHLDDLYPGWDGLRAGVEVLCTQVLVPLGEGRSTSYPSWDWLAAGPGPRRPVSADVDVVVIEGVGTLAAGCAGLLDVRVWLEAPAQERQRRALARDGDVFAPHWQQWVDQEAELFAGSGPPAADVVVDTHRGTVRWARLGP